jgi:hypothetical protein
MPINKTWPISFPEEGIAKCLHLEIAAYPCLMQQRAEVLLEKLNSLMQREGVRITTGSRPCLTRVTCPPFSLYSGSGRQKGRPSMWTAFLFSPVTSLLFAYGCRLTTAAQQRAPLPLTFSLPLLQKQAGRYVRLTRPSNS